MATNEREFHAYRGKPAKRSSGKFTIPDDDQVPSFHQYDEEQLWTVDAYDERRIKQLVAQGCNPLPSTHSGGKLFALDTRQLIKFLADSENVAIEFRTRRKAQLSDEQLAAKRAQMRALNATKQSASSAMNG